MKIENTKTPQMAMLRRRAGVQGADGDSFAAAFADETASPSPAGMTGGTPSLSTAADVSALLALQAADCVEGDAAASKRAKTRAEELLRKMDLLRLDLLSGGIPRDHLISLAQATKAARNNTFDPRLNEILDDIDLRAQVELAKYTPRSQG